jgi:hypothetical protein
MSQHRLWQPQECGAQAQYLVDCPVEATWEPRNDFDTAAESSYRPTPGGRKKSITTWKKTLDNQDCDLWSDRH